MNSPSFSEAVEYLLKQMRDIAGNLPEYPAVEQICIIHDVDDIDCHVSVYLRDDEISGGMPLTTCVAPDEADLEAFEIALYAAACAHKAFWPLAQRVGSLEATATGNQIR